VASGATGAWAGHADAVAVYEDGAWRFLTPKLGWCAWCDADGVLLVYDGTAWTDVAGGVGTMSGSVAQLGINDIANDPNLLTVRSNAALFNAVDVADSGTGDMRLQISKEAGANTASVVFSDAFSGRAEFGLIGSDAFKLKVSNDGTTFVEALAIDQSSGNAALPRGFALTGVISPSQITSNQNDYNPTGIASASVLNLSSDALRSVSGLAGGAEGRVIALVNTGSQIISLLNESASSTAANRFALGSDLAIGAKQATILRYDGTAARWYAVARSGGREVLTANRTYYVRTDGSNSNDGLSNTSGGAFLTIQKAIDIVAALDLSIYNVTIQVGSGTYTSGAAVNGAWIGAGIVALARMLAEDFHRRVQSCGLASAPAVDRPGDIGSASRMLSAMQLRILEELRQGRGDKEIAHRLQMSGHAVDYHLRQLRARFKVRNRVQLVNAAARAMPPPFSAINCSASRPFSCR
jgi:DNA-binding CsgD family transcriptional regulator